MDSQSTSPPPKYQTLSRTLLSRVRSLPVGAAISSERDLAEEFGVSRMTARRAVMELLEDGLLERHVGRGTFVAQPRLQMRLSLTSFTEDVLRKGKLPGAVVLERATRIADDASPFPVGTTLAVVDRLRTADGEPMAVEHTRLDASLVPELLDQELSGSLYDLLRLRYGLRLEHGEQRILAVECPPMAAQHLGLTTGKPVLRMDRRSHAHGRLVEHTTSWYRADVYELTATLQPE